MMEESDIPSCEGMWKFMVILGMITCVITALLMIFWLPTIVNY